MAAKDEVDTENAERVQKRVLREHNDVVQQRQKEEQAGLKKAQQVALFARQLWSLRVSSSSMHGLQLHLEMHDAVVAQTMQEREKEEFEQRKKQVEKERLQQLKKVKRRLEQVTGVIARYSLRMRRPRVSWQSMRRWNRTSKCGANGN
jgi:hypothetical protein